jgi:glycosyltransferase involved in cell wall biosynthesis
MTAPTASVVFRAFNCDRYIGQAIESILAQAFQNFEIVIVDDASSDGTKALLQTYAQRDDRIRVFRNETNRGPVRTMNIGLQHARGELIAVHDADDVSLPHRLETQVNFLGANPQIALIGGGAYFIDEEGEELKVGTGERKVAQEARQYLEKGYGFIHTSVMYRRKCIEAIGLYDEFFLYAHDYDMLIRMADTFDIVYHEVPLVKWRWLNSGITGRKKQAQAAFAELARTRSKAKKKGLSLDLQEEYNRLMAREDIANGVNRNLPLSDTRYYYCVGVLLLDKGKQQKARRRFWQALKHRDSIAIFLRTLVFYVLSFWPNSLHSRPVRTLRKAL